MSAKRELLRIEQAGRVKVPAPKKELDAGGNVQLQRNSEMAFAVFRIGKGFEASELVCQASLIVEEVTNVGNIN